MGYISSSKKPLPRYHQNTCRRVMMCIQNFNHLSDPKGYIDTAIAKYRGKITDFQLLVYEQYSTPEDLIGLSNLCHVNPIRINGLTTMEYFIRECHKVKIRVHAWFVMGYWTVWNGVSGLLITDMTDDASHKLAGDIYCCNFGNTEVRSTIISVINDFIKLNPGIDGIVLDYIRYDDSTVGGTTADVTQMVQDVRGSIRGRELTCDLKCDPYSESYFQRGDIWILNNYIDTAFYMDYAESLNYRNEFDYRWYPANTSDILYAFWGDDGDSTLKGQCSEAVRLKYGRNYALFQYSTCDDASTVQIIDDLLAGRSAVSYTNITKLSIDPGVSFTFSLNGSDKQILEADVGDHTTGVSLKAHVEAIHGELPLIIFSRPSAGYTQIYLRDYGTG